MMPQGAALVHDVPSKGGILGEDAGQNLPDRGPGGFDLLLASADLWHRGQPSGQGGNGGPNLQTRPNAKVLAKVIDQVTNGGGGMPAFKGQLSQQQIRDVSTFVTQKITK